MRDSRKFSWVTKKDSLETNLGSLVAEVDDGVFLQVQQSLEGLAAARVRTREVTHLVVRLKQNKSLQLSTSLRMPFGLLDA